MSVGSLVSAGPLLLAIPVAAAAGAVTFLSPCVLPLVPGYLSYITGMSGASADGATAIAPRAGTDQQLVSQTASVTVGAAAAAAAAANASAGAGAGASSGPANGLTAGPAASQAWTEPAELTAGRRRSSTLLGAFLFVLGFSAFFAVEGVAFGGIGTTLKLHQAGLDRLLGVLMIVLGLLFAGVFERFSFTGRIVKPSFRPRAGLASAPLLGVLFGIGWTPCIGPTLAAVLTLGLSTGTAARGGLLAFVYGLGIGIPFLIVAFAFDRGVTLFGFARRHARLITRIGGGLFILVGLLEVTGAWAVAIEWLKVHWLANYNPPI
jgi:cytochrome c-type biogenesis protein